ncbi:cupredoxin domain-containing protein [Kyrpidia spormannii]|uniref:EfeO-type cupredoxin-like domain-containing protein n=1 Tax=Kyrpidia spormannii TaxID=2055160 RepID=A0A6F9E773_9BACL|nr:cupredoxin domain-containing protein [Kyrpidia spormannii]CAB3392373.1 protein of unknown function [Kyrpidia spormannii]
MNRRVAKGSGRGRQLPPTRPTQLRRTIVRFAKRHARELTPGWHQEIVTSGPLNRRGFCRTVTVTPPSDNTQHISLVINPNYKLGPDGKLHDAYTPGDITVKAGQPVELTIYNLGKKGHPFISSALGVNVPVQGSQGTGEPAVFKTTFTPQKPGKYTWVCGLPCDGENNQWAMSHDNYMMGYITVQ